MWEHICRRGNVWNPKTAYVCSDHFTTNDFVRNLKAKLLRYNLKIKYLKLEASPTLNIPVNHKMFTILTLCLHLTVNDK